MKVPFVFYIIYSYTCTCGWPLTFDQVGTAIKTQQTHFSLRLELLLWQRPISHLANLQLCYQYTSISLSLSCTHTHSLSLSHTHTHTHSLSHIHTHTHTHSLSLSLTHTHTHTHTQCAYCVFYQRTNLGITSSSSALQSEESLTSYHLKGERN